MDAGLVEALADDVEEPVHHLAPIAACRLDRRGEDPVPQRIDVLEGEVLQLEVERVEAEPVRDRRVDVERLARDPAPVRRGHRVERTHVVQPIGELDQDDAHVLRHREQHLAEALGLRILARRELDLVELGNAVDHVGDRLAERGLELGLGDGGVLHHVVQQRGGETLRVEAPLREDAGDRQRVRDVRLAGLAELAAVRGVREVERALDEREVRQRQVVAEVPGELRDFRHAPYDGATRAASPSSAPSAASRCRPCRRRLRAARRRWACRGRCRPAVADPAEIWRARLVAASVSSKRLGIRSRQSSMVMRAMVRPLKIRGRGTREVPAAGGHDGRPAAEPSGARRGRWRSRRRLPSQSLD